MVASNLFFIIDVMNNFFQIHNSHPWPPPLGSESPSLLQGHLVPSSLGSSSLLAWSGGQGRGGVAMRTSTEGPVGQNLVT